MNIILYGFKNSGKTTAGEYLAPKLGCAFIDTDHLIEELYTKKNKKRKNVYSIYREFGEKQFRQYEQEVIKRLKDIKHTVVTVGGGAVLNRNNVKVLKNMGKLIYLNAPKAVLKKRILMDTQTVLFSRKDKEIFFEEVFSRREPIYQKTSDVVIYLKNKTVKQIVQNIIKNLDIGSKDGQ